MADVTEISDVTVKAVERAILALREDGYSDEDLIGATLVLGLRQLLIGHQWRPTPVMLAISEVLDQLIAEGRPRVTVN